ncbi:MAG: hypothetical protein V4772_08600 [Pseudomonadota bacterium]
MTAPSIIVKGATAQGLASTTTFPALLLNADGSLAGLPASVGTKPAAQSVSTTEATDLTVTTLRNAGTAVSTGTSVAGINKRSRIIATGFTTAGAGSVTISLYGSLDDTTYYTTAIGTITLTLGTTPTTDFFDDDGRWPFVRDSITAISGTGAQVTLMRAA